MAEIEFAARIVFTLSLYTIVTCRYIGTWTVSNVQCPMDTWLIQLNRSYNVEGENFIIRPSPGLTAVRIFTVYFVLLLFFFVYDHQKDYLRT